MPNEPKKTQDPSPRAYTIRDIAAHIGVAPSTVSLVLNGRRYVTAEMRQKVLQACKELHYIRPGVGRPSHYTRLRNTTEPVVVFYTRNQTFNGGIYQVAFNAARAELRANGFDVVVVNNPAAPPPGTIGILYLKDDDIKLPVPKVELLGQVSNRENDQITYDNREIGILAARFCLKSRIRKIACITSEYPLFIERVRAFRQELEANGVAPYLAGPLEEANLTESQMLLRLFRKILETQGSPVLFFSIGAWLTVEAYPLLLANGIRPGKDIVFISCDNDTPRLGMLSKPPTVIDIRADVIGRLGAQQLLWRIAHPDIKTQPITQRLLPVMLKPSVVGRSVRTIPDDPLLPTAANERRNILL